VLRIERKNHERKNNRLFVFHRMRDCVRWDWRDVGLEGISMNFIERFQSLWQLPSHKEMAAKELEEAKRRFLDAQSAREYATRMSDYHADRVKRLTNYLENSE
jgi:hypothetical protein